MRMEVMDVVAVIGAAEITVDTVSTTGIATEVVMEEGEGVDGAKGGAGGIKSDGFLLVVFTHGILCCCNKHRPNA